MSEGLQGESNIYGSEFAEAVIDNPGGAKRTIRFETGRLHQCFDPARFDILPFPISGA